MGAKIIDLKAYRGKNKITKDEIISYMLKNEKDALNRLNLTKEDMSTLDGDSVSLLIGNDVREYKSLCVVADKDSGRLKVGTKEDMYEYFDVAYKTYDKVYNLTQDEGFKVNRDDLMLVELPNCQAMVDAMWGTFDWVCKLIKEVESNANYKD